MAARAELAPGFAAAPGGRIAPAVAIARRTFADARIRTIGFAYLFAAVSYIQPVGYRDAYPKLSDRIAFAHSFGDNSAVRLFYGKPSDLLTIGGYSSWRVGGTLVIFAAVWGLLAAVRALRTEEDSGRAELILAGIVRRQTAYGAALAAIGAGIILLWVACLAGLVIGGLPAGASAFLALSVASVLPVFVGVGAVASQLAPTRRIALELGGAVVGVAFVLRVIADTSSGAGWLRWATPLGWAEEMRPFHHARPAVLLLPLTASVLLLALGSRIAARRDLGSAMLGARDTAQARMALLSSPTTQALRDERVGLSVWLGGGPVHVCADRGCKARGSRPAAGETMLALPVSRRGWLGGRLALAVCAAAAISLAAGFFTWAGAASEGVGISLPRMLEAGANCLPIAILFLGVAALAYALLPRASAGIAYGLVTVAFLWQQFGSLLGVPKWLVEATPFAHVGMIPAQSFRSGAALVMLGIGVLCAVAAIGRFERRDLLGA